MLTLAHRTKTVNNKRSAFKYSIQKAWPKRLATRARRTASACLGLRQLRQAQGKGLEGGKERTRRGAWMPGRGTQDLKSGVSSLGSSQARGQAGTHQAGPAPSLPRVRLATECGPTTPVRRKEIGRRPKKITPLLENGCGLGHDRWDERTCGGRSKGNPSTRGIDLREATPTGGSIQRRPGRSQQTRPGGTDRGCSKRTCRRTQPRVGSTPGGLPPPMAPSCDVPPSGHNKPAGRARPTKHVDRTDDCEPFRSISINATP